MITVNTPIFSPSPTFATLAWFEEVLKEHSSPALGEAEAIYKEFAATGFNTEIALGQFAAESSYGRNGYATVTKSWGNQLYANWLSGHATPYAPGNGYTYAKFASWTDSVTWGYIPLMTAYKAGGYTTLGTMAAHWLGTTVGSPRWNNYTNNIIYAAGVNEKITPSTPPVENTMREFTVIGPSVQSVTVNNVPNHAVIPLDGVSPLIPVAAGEVFGGNPLPIHLNEPYPGGAAGADRSTSWMVLKNGLQCALLQSDGTATVAPPADCTASNKLAYNKGITDSQTTLTHLLSPLIKP